MPDLHEMHCETLPSVVPQRPVTQPPAKLACHKTGVNAAFLIDGLWNEGMSGAPILAVRGEGGGLEWVGIVLAASAQTEYRLVAEEAVERTQDSRRRYEGPIYLQPVQEIRYGITFSVPMTVIRRFLDEHRSLLRDRGYSLPSF